MLCTYAQTPMRSILAIAIPYCIQMLVANFVEPVVLGKRLNLCAPTHGA
eukprot:COSAG01_NODE_64751_length_275_cov_0.886364_1_plen_48_part_01